MIAFDQQAFLHEFPQWRIAISSPTNIEMICSSGDYINQAPSIISFLYQTVPDSEWHFVIRNKRLIIHQKSKAIYNRMYTSGCFDIFHYGHLNILVKSKELCNHLIVGVSTDELIESEKGKRPIIPFEERIKVVQSIGLVDEVIAQTDKNKQRIVDMYDIDAISVGSDWKGRYPKVSCAMEYFEYTKNVSSTILRDALKLNAS